MSTQRKMHVGAELIEDGSGNSRASIRVWAPAAKRVELVLVDRQGKVTQELAMEPESNGYHSIITSHAKAGSLYFFRLNREQQLYPDPASRFQPDGPHRPSELIDATAFQWTDGKWPGTPLEGQVIYEMHIGTFTQEGTWSAASEQLPELKDVGITLLEVMPIATFPGKFGWGYDGVNLFAPTPQYGRPDDFREFVNRAHEVGIGVILDVVYNHLGPDGNYLAAFSPDYFSHTQFTDWGDAINFDGPNSQHVRDYYLANAEYWIREFHLDGLRLDATQDIHDNSSEHILAAIARSLRQSTDRSLILVAENEPQHARLVRPREKGGYALTAIWSDDFHHSATVLLTGKNEAYYSDYLGKPQEFISAIKRGFLYQGQWYSWQDDFRGAPAWDIAPAQFVHFIQNHDQIANSGDGRRVHLLTSPGRYRAMTALLLLGPQTPMLFQGQEFASSSPFLFFADHKPELAELIEKGRKEFLAQFATLKSEENQAKIRRPNDPHTFMLSKLNFDEREKHRELYNLHRDLLRLRREDPTFRLQRAGAVDGAILGENAFVLRFFGNQGDDRLLIMNFDSDQVLSPAPEPLLAPIENCGWQLLWSSEKLEYGGVGAAPLETNDQWLLPGQAAIVLKPIPRAS